MKEKSTILIIIPTPLFEKKGLPSSYPFTNPVQLTTDQ